MILIGIICPLGFGICLQIVAVLIQLHNGLQVIVNHKRLCKNVKNIGGWMEKREIALVS